MWWPCLTNYRVLNGLSILSLHTTAEDSTGPKTTEPLFLDEVDYTPVFVAMLACWCFTLIKPRVSVKKPVTVELRIHLSVCRSRKGIALLQGILFFGSRDSNCLPHFGIWSHGYISGGRDRWPCKRHHFHPESKPSLKNYFITKTGIYAFFNSCIARLECCVWSPPFCRFKVSTTFRQQSFTIMLGDYLSCFFRKFQF